ncbi:MAG TPA: exodeoxyribonuclease VII large subunit [Methanosarcinales archaeon]|nr:exodeoxyribonuclease VII large subunit [Methanosarcinales archaeon]
MLYTVHELTQYVKDRLQNDSALSGISVRGEMSNFTHHTSGHMYFTLKDERSQLNCVMFRGANQKLKFTPETGLGVICMGDITVYEKRGVYQLMVWDMQPDGIGALYKAFEQLKARLDERGFFDDAHKKPLPQFPETIGVVTSRTGAVLHDILNVIRRRFPAVRIVLAPTRVQGDCAASEIAHAIRKMNRLSLSQSRSAVPGTDGIDVMIVARGGGSIEELWAFNEIEVAEAVYESEIPIISAVGHETDVTICDFVSDVRAPTPSAAAEIAVPDREQLRQQIAELVARLVYAMKMAIGARRGQVSRLERGVVHPRDRINQLRQYTDELTRQMHTAVAHRLELCKKDLSMLEATLHALSPLNHLQRGYSIVQRVPDHAIVNAIADVSRDDELQILVTDGKIECQVRRVKEGWDHE